MKLGISSPNFDFGLVLFFSPSLAVSWSVLVNTNQESSR